MRLNLFKKQEKRSSDTSTVFEPKRWLFSMFGNQTASKINITHENSLRFSAVFACTRVLCETLACLPLNVYETTKEGKKIISRNHPYHYLLHTEPDGNYNSIEWRELMQASLTLWGNAYSIIHRDNSGRVIRLEWIAPNLVQVDKIEGEIYYQIVDRGIFLNHEMIHIRLFSLDGITGISPISIAREGIAMGLATEEFGATFFGNGATLDGVLESPNPMKAEQIKQLENSWGARHGATKNAHKTAILSNGLKYTRIGIPPEDSQFIQTRKFQAEEIAGRIYRIPLHMIGLLDRATNNNIEHQSLEFIKFTMLPYFSRWEAELNRKLFSTNERSKYYVKFNIEGLLRGDTASRSTFYRELFNIGVLSQNEIREKEDLNAVEGGDKHFVPLNMIESSEATNKNTSENE